MACGRIALPNGSTAIVCGLRRTKTKPCQFCGGQAGKLCDWPTEKPVKIRHHQLAETDTIVTVQHKYRLKVQGLHSFMGSFRRRQTMSRFEITADIDRFTEFPLVKHPVTMYGLTFPDGRCWLYYCFGDDKVTVLRPGTCDAPCCDLHSREVGEDKDYCMEHWKAWEAVG